MSKLHHPLFAGNTVEVPDRDVEAWREQGWRKTPLKTTGAATAAGSGPAKSPDGEATP